MTSFLLLTALALGGIQEAGKPQDASTALLERVRLFDASVDPVNRLSGVLLVARGDEILLHEGFGMADQEFGVPNAKDTRFCIASITKILTSLVAVQLLLEERLHADDTLATFVPDFPRGDEITVTHLLNHRAGLPARVTKASETWRPMSAAEVTERAKAFDLLYEPGARSVYSSATYTVLARVIEIVEDAPFAEVLRRRVFEPAGMADTLDPDATQLVARRARPYVPGRDTLFNAPLQDLSFLAGAGSVVSTAVDLLRFLRAAEGGTFGAAWNASQGAGPYHWTGASNGFHSWVDHDPATGTTVIFTGNSYGRAAGELRDAMTRILQGEAVLATERPTVTTVDPARLARYAGNYQSRPGSFWPVRERDGELFVSDVVALPVSETVFWYQPWNTLFHFERESEDALWTLRPEGQVAWPRVGDVE